MSNNFRVHSASRGLCNLKVLIPAANSCQPHHHISFHLFPGVCELATAHQSNILQCAGRLNRTSRRTYKCSGWHFPSLPSNKSQAFLPFQSHGKHQRQPVATVPTTGSQVLNFPDADNLRHHHPWSQLPALNITSELAQLSQPQTVLFY